MNFIKKLGISLLYIFVPIIVLLFIFTLLNYFNLISYNVLNILRFILLVISLLIGGYKFGEHSLAKGWLEGLKLGLIILVIYILINYLVFNIVFHAKHIIYYVIILGSSILGSILGINKKKKNS